MTTSATMRENSAVRDEVLCEAERLWNLGLAIHWLVPREKRPLKAGWTRGNRASWPELRRDYYVGVNLGVRLGNASTIGEGYLACIDVDVKSDDPAHRLELEARLGELIPAGILSSAARVSSGRGLGSRHIYVLTREPIAPLTLASSGERTRVSAPGTKVSPEELRILSPEDLAKGTRLRAAWEICLYSEGRQMVLPPSIHPTTGKRYVWDKELLSREDLPVLDTAAFKGVRRQSPRAQKSGGGAFAFVEKPVDLFMDPRVSTGVLALVADADGVTDHSAGLLRACRLLLGAGLSRDEILTVLTDPENALGRVAYRHRGHPADVRFRVQAAEWVWKYTLKNITADNDFDSVVELAPATPELSDDQAQAQTVELLAQDWETQLERGGENGGGPPKSKLRNVILILENAVAPDVFKKNLFTGLEVYAVDTPWGARAGREISDAELIAIKAWLSERFRFEPPISLVNEAVTLIAHRNAFHPVRDYLNGLNWDGVARIDTWMEKYLTARAPKNYLRATSRKLLCAMVARAFEPGKKYDQVVILEGAQGVGKSTAIRKLASDEWFTDAHIDIRNKDAILAIRGVWVSELGELSSLRKADTDQLKEFMGRISDRVRVPYGRRTENFPRQCVFIGSTNNSEYLSDPTGNRRFWPIRVGHCDFDGIERDRDQLFAEALWYYQLGERLDIDKDDPAFAEALAEQESREFTDIWVEIVENFLADLEHRGGAEQKFNPKIFRMSDILGDYGPVAGTRMSMADQKRMATCLRKLGFSKKIRRVDGRLGAWWSK